MEAIQVVMQLAVLALILLLLTHFWSKLKTYLNGASTGAATKSVASAVSQTGPTVPSTPSDAASTAPSVYVPPAPSQPALLESALVVGALFAVIGWSAKEIVGFARLRAELAVLDVLSDKRPRTYHEIISDV